MRSRKSRPLHYKDCTQLRVQEKEKSNLYPTKKKGAEKLSWKSQSQSSAGETKSKSLAGRTQPKTHLNPEEPSRKPSPNQKNPYPPKKTGVFGAEIWYNKRNAFA